MKRRDPPKKRLTDIPIHYEDYDYGEGCVSYLDLDRQIPDHIDSTSAVEGVVLTRKRAKKWLSSN